MDTRENSSLFWLHVCSGFVFLFFPSSFFLSRRATSSRSSQTAELAVASARGGRFRAHREGRAGGRGEGSPKGTIFTRVFGQLCCAGENQTLTRGAERLGSSSLSTTEAVRIKPHDVRKEGKRSASFLCGMGVTALKLTRCSLFCLNTRLAAA